MYIKMVYALKFNHVQMYIYIYIYITWNLLFTRNAINIICLFYFFFSVNKIQILISGRIYRTSRLLMEKKAEARTRSSYNYGSSKQNSSTEHTSRARGPILPYERIHASRRKLFLLISCFIITFSVAILESFLRN